MYGLDVFVDGKSVKKEVISLLTNPEKAITMQNIHAMGWEPEFLQAVRLIHSMYTDKRDIQAVNTRNNGTISNLPAQAAVEVSCVITKDGPKPISVGELPVAVRGLVGYMKSFEEVAIEAAVTGNYNTALLAMTMNPFIPSDQTAKTILNEMLEAHKEHLPQFTLK